MKLPFEKRHIDAAKEMGVAFDISGDLSDAEIVELMDTTAHNLMAHGFDEDYNPTEQGRICEEILDIVGDT